ncbi:hypothetical protein [Streptomyces sp. XY152]|uniref:hypothetical protein n=1 Tax=Streptomyces sp. XY152 TaxID=1415560 RepID=UPI0006C1605E|nr:hypothetical protein [Streptomyces sp. XY152]KOV28418.1 hypothetical protein ADK58_11535 [Streptomyces sp. XY152]
MSGGQRYWNEDTQRWEDGGDAAAPVTPPPPPRPEFLPSAPGVPASAAPAPDDVPAGRVPAPAAGHGAWPGPELPHGAARPPAEPAPPAGRGPGRRLLWGVLGGAAAAGAAVALLLPPLVDGDGTDGGPGSRDDHAATSGPAPAGGATPGPSDVGTAAVEPTDDVTDSPSPRASGLPADYELHTDAEGFTIGRPLGWTREAVASRHGMDVVNYRSADGLHRLQVYEVAESSPEESFDLFLSDSTPKADGFEKVALERVEEAGVLGLRLEYRADSLRGEPEVGGWHVQDVRFRAPGDGKVYAIAAYGPPTDGIDPERHLALTALAHFCPPDTTCRQG